jgi:hypothetical protein
MVRLRHISAWVVKHFAAWPLVVKVPVLVAGLMVTVTVTTSQVVLWRFAQDRLFAEVDIAASLRVRREILLTLVLVNGCLTLAFALGGYFVIRLRKKP